jgi:hypothetical protein
VLVGVAPDGFLEAPVELVPKSVGTEWISVSYDARKVVLFSKTPDSRIIVVDFDAAPAGKSCEDPDGGESRASKHYRLALAGLSLRWGRRKERNGEG